MFFKITRTFVVFICFSLLAGCGAVILGGAATTATVATDRRSAGQQVDDQTIELRSSNDMEKEFGDKARISSMSYAGRLLLVGDVPSQADKQKAEEIGRNIDRVTDIQNFIRIGDKTPLSVRTNDTWLTSKVKSNMIATKDVPFRTIKVTTERGVVYLMGMVTKDEGDRAAKVAASINGVNKVVKLFKTITPEQVQDGVDLDDSSSAKSDADNHSNSEGAQAMPVK